MSRVHREHPLRQLWLEVRMVRRKRKRGWGIVRFMIKMIARL